MGKALVQGAVGSDGSLRYVKVGDVGTVYGGVPAVSGSSAKAGGTLAVPITGRVCALTTSGVEALTLANGVPGQRLTCYLASTGGDGTMTPATKTGFTAVVFHTVGDTVALEYIDDTVGWIVLGIAGKAVTTLALIT